MTALQMLDDHHSWKLERISHKTYPEDIINKDSRSMTEEDCQIVRSRAAYRCRIGKGRWFYARTPEAAADLAIKALPFPTISCANKTHGA